MTKVTQSNLAMMELYQNQVVVLDRMINTYAAAAKTTLGVMDNEGFIMDYLLGLMTLDALCKALDLKLELNESQPLLEAA